MANEATVQASLQIKTGFLYYRPPAIQYQANVAGVNGPTPGAVKVSTAGTDVSLSELGAFGGLCRIANIDATNWVEYGIHDTVTAIFYPLGQLLAGEFTVIRLSPNLQTTEPDVGTHITATTLRFKANVAQVVVVIDAFDP